MRKCATDENNILGFSDQILISYGFNSITEGFCIEDLNKAEYIAENL